MARPWSPIIVPHRLCESVLDVLLPAQTALAALDLAEQPQPSIYDFRRANRLRYRPDQLGVKEEWLSPRWLIARGVGDCKSVACWRVAELRRAGEAAEVRYVRHGDVFHVFVERANGAYEDPSTLLGMPLPNRFPWPMRR
jgi:hypothetical protein